VVIGGWPVQILPPYSPLVEEAVLGVRDCKYEDLVVPVLAAEYLCAIAAWRRHARAMTWEQKIAAIERMRERQAAIRRARRG